MRITIVISSLGSGGAERVVTNMASYWAKETHSVTIATLADSELDHYAVDGAVSRVTASFFNAHNHGLSRLVAVFKRIHALRKTIRDSTPDIVVSFVDKTNVRVLLAMQMLRIPVIVAERSHPVHWPLHWLWRVLRVCLYRRASYVVTQTEGVARWARKFVPKGRIVIIPNCVYGERTAAPRSVDLHKAVMVGRMTYEKGHDILINAWPAVLADIPHARLELIGDGPLRESLESLTKRLGIQNSVEFIGTVPDARTRMPDASLLAVPSRFEGFPNVILEAMSLGVPVVASDCEFGPSDIIRDGVDGDLVRPADPTSLATAIIALMLNPDRRAAYSASAQCVWDRFSEDKVMRQWNELLNHATAP